MARSNRILALVVVSIIIGVPAHSLRAEEQPEIVLEPVGWPKVASVNKHYLAFNIEMAEITGGDFWAPYGDPLGRRLAPRPPLDLADPRLLQMAQGLAPSVIRVSGTWANSTYIPAEGEQPPLAAPPGFGQVLHRDRWDQLAGLVRATGSSLLLSFPASAGARHENGTWSDEQAGRLVALARSTRTPITAVEFINEPNLVRIGALPADYSASDYARDFRLFRQFAERELPGVPILGHSASGTGGDLPVERIAGAAAGISDVVSYHFYGALSARCAEFGNQTSAAEALSPEWLARTGADHDYYAELRDRYDPGKPIWLTETAQAACGGDVWASTFRDTFRFLDQLGRLARANVQLVAHNTLASGDYALIDREQMQPRPNFWAAVLWKQKMGPRVLAPAVNARGLAVYAHCHPAGVGGVTVMILSLSDDASRVSLPVSAQITQMAASDLDARMVTINAAPPVITQAGPGGWQERRITPGNALLVRPRSIVFLEMRDAGNPACN